MTIWIQRFPLNPAARFYFILFAFMHFKEGGVKIYFMIQMSLFMYCFGTIHTLFMGPTATLFRKKILKIGLMVLFTHLKIILLQCFQFSVSATISSIQMDPLLIWQLIDLHSTPKKKKNSIFFHTHTKKKSN